MPDSPRTVAWIVEHRDQIAEEFESSEPQLGGERDPQLLRDVTAARTGTPAAFAAAVAATRAAGATAGR